MPLVVYHFIPKGEKHGQVAFQAQPGMMRRAKMNVKQCASTYFALN
jgi:hypothetical protein